MSKKKALRKIPGRFMSNNSYKNKIIKHQEMYWRRMDNALYDKNGDGKARGRWIESLTLSDQTPAPSSKEKII